MKIEKRLVNDSDGLVHRVQKPTGSGPFPATVMLHGWGGDENVMWIFAHTVPQGWLILAPRGIHPDGEGGFNWGPHMPGIQSGVAGYTEATGALEGFIRSLPDLYGAVPARTYLMGFSQGAAMSFVLAFIRPGLLSGIAGLAGMIPSGVEPLAPHRPLEGLPVFMANGTEDERVPIAEARKSVERIKAAGAQVTYVEEQVGHKIGREGMRALKEWWHDRR